MICQNSKRLSVKRRLNCIAVEVLRADTLISGQLYLWPLWQNLAHTNSVFTHSHKRPAPVADTFSVFRGCPLTEALTVLRLPLDHREPRQTVLLCAILHFYSECLGFTEWSVEFWIAMKTLNKYRWINVNLPYLLCTVVFLAQNGEFKQFEGVCFCCLLYI